MPTVSVQESTFATLVLESPIPVLVDFWGPSCGPCVIMAPVLEELAEEYAGQITIAKVDASQNPGLVAAYGVISLPTLILLIEGSPVDTVIGGRPKRFLHQYIQTRLDTASATPSP